MERYGKELEFISRIHGDGKGTTSVAEADMRHLDKDTFNLRSLSITHRTYIAMEFNSFVVRLKNDPL